MSHRTTSAPTSLIRQACEAQETFSLDELESYASSLAVIQREEQLAELNSLLLEIDGLLDRGGES